jgi:glycosyltransferase involved in cell wall biosynthesis
VVATLSGGRVIEGLVSTVIPVHNRARFLREAVASVLAQTWRPIEIVIVDDGSTDDTPQCADELEEANPGVIRLVRQNNAGPGAARQRGLDASHGEFVQFLDSDDLLMPRKFELQVAALRADPLASICYSKTWFNENGRRAACPAQRTGKVHRTVFPALLAGRIWETSTPLYRRDALDRIGPWPATWQMEDWRYDAQAGAAQVQLAYCDEFLAEYRVHGEPRLAHAWTRDQRAMRDRLEAYLQIALLARAAGVRNDAPELRHFLRSVFWIAREAGSRGMHQEADRLLQLALSLQALNHWDLQLFRAVRMVVGWKAASRMARWRELFRRGCTTEPHSGSSRLDHDALARSPQTAANAAHRSHDSQARPANAGDKLRTPDVEVSVLMAVYNGADRLESSICSVLEQQGCRFELIVVNDGSTDGSAQELDRIAAQDSRVRVLHKANGGLTAALIDAAAMARGEFLARQDAGDYSLPGRLQLQRDALRADQQLVFISCVTEFVDPNCAHLYEARGSGFAAHPQNILDLTQPFGLRDGPSHHGSVMFRAETYRQCGGYRPAFYYGQDWDLWYRLAEVGKFQLLADTLYRATMGTGDISLTQRPLQQEIARLSLEALKLRRAGLPDAPALNRAFKLRPGSSRPPPDMGAGHYFLGECLRRNRNHAPALAYLREAVSRNPLNLKYWLRLAQCAAAGWRASGSA